MPSIAERLMKVMGADLLQDSEERLDAMIRDLAATLRENPRDRVLTWVQLVNSLTEATGVQPGTTMHRTCEIAMLAVLRMAEQAALAQADAAASTDDDVDDAAPGEEVRP